MSRLKWFSFQVVDEGEEKYIHLTDPELRKVIGEQIVELLKQKKAQCFPLDSLMLTFTLHYGFMIPLHDLKVATMEELMAKLKHVLKVYYFMHSEWQFCHAKCKKSLGHLQ